MPNKRPQLAKLTRPRLHKAVARERLFALLDEAREHKPAICVVGPPGAGKTTLVASWLDARGIKGIWYQVDPGDADLATFFYYLGEAVKPFIRKGQRPLPLLTPEYLQDVEGFSRRYFRELFRRLPDESTVVVDNYQEIGPEQRFHSLIAQAVEEVPVGRTLIAISRRDPPDCYSRLIANENVRLLEWDELKLTLLETRDIVAERALVDQETLQRLYDRSGGWAAGLTLMLEQPDKLDGPLNEMSRVFHYFAGQIFTRASPDTQRFLMQTALLPNIPVSLAVSLTGNGAASEILEDFYRRHLFTHRRPGAEPTYWYHALFRDFLRSQIDQRIPEADRIAMTRHAARVLHAADAYEDAFALFCEARDWVSAGQITLECAERLNASGRGQTLRAWITSLPDPVRESQPWLQYWLGVALMPVGLSDSRIELEQAFNRFKAQDDHAGQMRAAASVIHGYFLEWSHWQPLDRWIDELEGLMRQHPRYPSASIEFDVCCAMLIATLYRKPGHPLLTECALRVAQMLDTELDLTQQAIGASMLLTYAAVANRHEFGQRIFARNQHLMHNETLSPLMRVWWCARMTRFLCDCGSYAKVEAIARIGLALIEQSGMKGVRSAWGMLVGHICWAMIGLGKIRKAETQMQELESNAGSLRPSDRIIAQEWRTVYSLHLHDVGRALEASADAVAGASAAGMIYWDILQRVSYLAALAESDRSDGVKEQAAICRALFTGTCLQYFEPELLIIEAYLLFRKGEPAGGRELLKKGFRLARELRANWRYTRFCGWMMSRVCAEAMDQDIEVDYVRSLIERFELKPRLADFEKWPWPIRINTLGTFEIIKDGQPIQFRGKAPRRVLGLLKVIIALGPTDVPVHQVIDALWPDSEGDSGYDAFTVTLGRLRKLLGSASCVVTSADRVSLNPGVCWVDAEAFFTHSSSPGHVTDTVSAPAFQRIQDLYRGPFLPEEADAPWALVKRLRLHKQYLTLLEHHGKALEEAENWAEAIRCYERGLAADQLAESIYQGLMRCHIALNHPAEGLSVYRKMRQALSIVLGIEPSSHSQTLARQLTVGRP